jgi:hypothetical protein
MTAISFNTTPHAASSGPHASARRDALRHQCDGTSVARGND